MKNKEFKALCKMIAKKIKFDVDYQWYLQFTNLDKIKILHRMIRQKGRGKLINSTEEYKEYITKYYYDITFNYIFAKWQETGSPLYKPSIDHITPLSKGGKNTLENYRITTWFENNARNNIDMDKWNILKPNIQEYFIG